MTNLIGKPDVEALSGDKDIEYRIHLQLYGNLGVVVPLFYGPIEMAQPCNLKLHVMFICSWLDFNLDKVYCN